MSSKPPTLLALLLAVACASSIERSETGDTAAMRADEPGAAAALRDAQGRDVGTVRLAEAGGGVRITADVRDLPPGEHGFHIHMTGACEPTFEAAGEHFNPEGKQHGLQNPAGPHAGDAENLRVGQDGTGQMEGTNDRVTLGEGPNSVFDSDGSAIVVHAQPDDQRTDPSGNSGERIACGVIERG